MMVAENLPVDRGWAWVILFSVTTTQFLYVGTLKSFGIFFVEILDVFKQSVSVTSIITGIQGGVYCIVSLPLLLCGINYYGVRKSVIVGSIMIAMGYSISAFAPNIDFLYFSISLIVGVGSAFLYAPSLIILGQYFDKRRGIATGIAISGGCLGGLLLPPIYRILLDTYGLRGTLMLTGGLLFHNTAMACFLRPLEFYHKKKSVVHVNKCPQASNSDVIINTGTTKHKSTDTIDRIHKNGGVNFKSNVKNFLNGDNISGSLPVISKSSPLTPRAQLKKRERFRTFSETDDNIKETSREKSSSTISLSSLYKYISLDDVANMSIISIKELKSENLDLEELEEIQKSKCCKLSFSVFRNPSYVLFLFVHMFSGMAPALLPLFLPVFFKENGLNNEEVVILVAVLGASDFVGRILSGYFADKPWIKKYQIIMVTQGIAGIVVNCSSLFNTFWTLVIFSVLVGISTGGIIAVVVPTLADIIGMEQFTSGFAFLIITQGPFLAISAPIFGFLRDQTGSYMASFHFLGSAALIASLLLFIEPLIQKCKSKEQQDNSNEMFTEENESLTLKNER